MVGIAVLTLLPPSPALPGPAARGTLELETALGQMRKQSRLPVYERLPDIEQRAALAYMQALLAPMLSGAR